jgi:hypothetical protein
MFKITDITTTSTDHPNVAFISETTTVRHASLMDALSDSSAPLSGSATKGILPKEDWLAAVRDRIGGYDDTLYQIIDLMYGFIESATLNSEDSMTGMATATTAWTKPCFRSPFKGILISGRPGTGKTVLASRLAESSGIPYAIINCPDVFQTGNILMLEF